jgi:hypothetical protein
MGEGSGGGGGGGGRGAAGREAASPGVPPTTAPEPASTSPARALAVVDGDVDTLHGAASSGTPHDSGATGGTVVGARGAGPDCGVGASSGKPHWATADGSRANGVGVDPASTLVWVGERFRPDSGVAGAAMGDAKLPERGELVDTERMEPRKPGSPGL